MAHYISVLNVFRKSDFSALPSPTAHGCTIRPVERVAWGVSYPGLRDVWKFRRRSEI